MIEPRTHKKFELLLGNNFHNDKIRIRIYLIIPQTTEIVRMNFLPKSIQEPYVDNVFQRSTEKYRAFVCQLDGAGLLDYTLNSPWRWFVFRGTCNITFHR